MLLSGIVGFDINVPAVKAADEIYNGDLILTGNNVTTIENRIFHINGSIIATENSTLILNNAWINFTQTSNNQFEMDIRGNAQLIVENSNITSEYQFSINLLENSTAAIEKLSTTAYLIYLWGYSSASISNSTFPRLCAMDYANISAINCTISQVLVRNNPHAHYQGAQ